MQYDSLAASIEHIIQNTLNYTYIENPHGADHCFRSASETEIHAMVKDIVELVKANFIEPLDR